MSQAIKKVGNYKLIKRIGHGATAQVFQGKKNGSSQRFAIKMIKLSGLSSKQRDMITKEVSIIKNISHPNIVKLMDSLETTNNYYLIFQFCEKGDLEHFLKNNHSPLIPQQTVQKITYCLADAINLIHSKGIVHRDIKLSNILLKKDCEIKLADFGFAKEIDQNFMMQTYCGTPITMAPQILQGKYYDKKCDIWSLGVILFQLVYGKLPFSITQGYNKFVELVTSKEVQFPSKPKMPQEFKILLYGALQKNPQKRLNIGQFIQNSWVQQGNNALKINESCKVQTVGELLRNVSGQVKIQAEQKQKFPSSKKSVSNRKSEQSQQGEAQQQLEQNSSTNNEKAHKLQLLIAVRVYKTLRQQIEKIIVIHKIRRQHIEKEIQEKRPFNDTLKDTQISLRELLYKLDQNFIDHLFEAEIAISTQTDLQKFKLSQVKSIQRPLSLNFINNLNPNKAGSVKKVKPMEAGSSILEFLRNALVVVNLQNEDKMSVYKIVMDYLQVMRRFLIRLQILFPTHHFVEISLSKILQFIKSGECLKESDPIKSPEGNYVTIAIQCSQKDQKMGQTLKNLKNNCQKRILQIQKDINGY